MQLKGKVHEIYPVQQVTDTFKKREFVVEYAENAQYPEFIKFETSQDKCDLVDKIKVGDMVEVFFNLRGRPWTNKEGVKVYFNSLGAWRINSLDEDSSTNNSSSNANSMPSAPASGSLSADEGGDDLPF